MRRRNLPCYDCGAPAVVLALDGKARCVACDGGRAAKQAREEYGQRGEACDACALPVYLCECRRRAATILPPPSTPPDDRAHTVYDEASELCRGIRERENASATTRRTVPARRGR